MPELPEVETVRAGLDELIRSKKIKEVKLYDSPKSWPNDVVSTDKFVKDSSILKVRRRAKLLLIDLSSNYTIAVHLKMTGQLVFVGEESRFGAGHPTDSLIHNLPDKSTRVELKFDDNDSLFFNDQRKFGWMKLVPTPEVDNLDFMKKVGPEPLDDSFTLEVFKERLARRKKSNIKAVLLDQTVLAGLGNIYADESMWAAKINPKLRVNEIPDQKIVKLYESIREILAFSIQAGGSTNKNYVNAKGERGKYLDFANVYAREGLPCKRCGEPIAKFKHAGRGTHVCLNCQEVEL